MARCNSLMRAARLFLALCTAAASALPLAAQAERRVALVIGNSAYSHVSSLANPGNDARLMAETLASLGFALVGNGAVLDARKAALDRVVQEFGREIQGADVALFYYAGHGIQVRGANYLVAVDANPVREADVDFQMLDVALVLRQMASAGSRLNIVMLDACRNNPFAGRDFRMVRRGLAQMQAPEGTLISYATQPDNVALDGEGGHSPYTRAVSEAVRRPGLDIFRTFNEVGLAVKRVTGGAQQPWISTSPIAGDFYFAGAAAAQSAALEASRPAGLPAVPSPNQPRDGLRNLIAGEAAEKIRAVASQKKMTLPAFDIAPPEANVPDALRRFVGVWVTTQGFNKVGRQAMLVISEVDAAGKAGGIYAWGPPTPGMPPRLAKLPAGFQPVSGRISNGRATFDTGAYTLTATMGAGNVLHLVHRYKEGMSGMADAAAVWNLAQAESRN